MSNKEESLNNQPVSNEDAVVHNEAARKRNVPKWLSLTILWSALGPLSMAYSISIIASSLAQPTFLTAFRAMEQSNLTALFSTVGGDPNIGGIFGNILTSWMSDKYGRKPAILVLAGLSVIGQVLSGGSAHNWGMLIFARFLTGFAGWPLAAVAVTYQSELAITEVRGFLASFVGISIALGYAVAAWVGFGFFYYEGENAWRVPLLIGVILPILLLAFSPFVPESPRWLCLNGREEEAKSIIYKMHKSAADPNNLYADQEFRTIAAQATVDRSLDSSWLQMFRKPSYRKRALITILVAIAGQGTGIQAVTTFGPSFYAAIGYSPRDQLLLSAGWITVAPIMAVLLQQILDKVGRRPLMWSSCFASAVALAILAALTKHFTVTDNQNGKNAVVAFIYVFIGCYMLGEPTMYVFFGEIATTNMRAKNAALAILTINLMATWITYATPYALVNIGYKYYFVFMSISFVCGILLYLYMPETKLLPLEGVGAIFGDGDEIAEQQREVQRLAQMPYSGPAATTKEVEKAA